ncbi:thioredoxin reductase [Aquimarina sp. EL_43]|uniref:NAD(P)-binding domain-containing protein n=1 Tax=unclassified Aquimarina TaxID=2627091 RepID=UPI0018CB7C87|nr:MULTISPECIES: NAD(P)-binding domain-containing protein [unclassified Aquimarina]MBG6130321.1 thioredoxin reductase [Aquimarina sp. EL_35]MBG6149101.1 thioredoxin reductase [Aquimarina sp. EL_32]MBG6168525.1 thioredoxin reductase [Aquimarina sp. EL_43]
MMQNNNLPIAIIGAGPVGLAAAAHLLAQNLPFIVFESGSSVGQNIRSWSHVRVFSPWKYNIDRVAKELLEQTDWIAPDENELPTGQELVEHYFRPLANLPQIKPHIHLNSKVLSIGRKGLDKMKTWGRESKPFSIKVQENGNINYYEAKAVIDATGTWNQPNPIGSGGVFAEGEQELNEHIFYGIPNVKAEHLERYKNKNVVVVGGGHSAINALLDLGNIQKEYPETQLNWVLRKDNMNKVYGGKQEDALEARGALGIRIEQLVNSGKLNVYTPFHILKLTKKEDGIQIIGDLNGEIEAINQIDEIISNTGSRPNLEMIREVRTDLDASLESVFDLAELIDPNVHSCGTVRPHGEKELRHPEKDFYIVGSKSYGRAPTFLMATGYEQVRSIVAHMAGDIEAAERVELNLPETGVCSTDFATDKKSDSVACCSSELTIEGVETTSSGCRTSGCN